MSKEREKLLNETYEEFIHVGLFSNMPLDILDNMVAGDVMGYGTTVDEKIFSLSEFRELINRQRLQSEGLKLNWNLTPVFRRISSNVDSAVFADDVFLVIETENGNINMQMRFTTVFEFLDGKWMVVHWHGSKGENVESETDTFGMEEWKQKAGELEKIVAERTADLVIKNKELEIEAALEKVRSTSLSMHSSGDLGKVVTTMLKNLQDLGFTNENGGAAHIIIFTKGSREFVQWSADPFLASPVRTRIPYRDIPMQSGFFEAKEKGLDFFAGVYSFEEKNEFFTHAFEYSDLKQLPDELKQMILESKTYSNWVAIEENSAVTVNSLVGNQLSENQIVILKRFAKVFEQSYIRFLDLQKAEAQARESQIQLSLERVRARTMAMQHSEELSETAAVLFEQFNVLGESPERIAIEIVNEKENVFDIWATQHGGSQLNLLYKASLDEPHVMQKMYAAWKSKKKSITIDLQGVELEEYFQFLNNAGLPVQREIFGNRRVQNVATFSKGILTIITPEPRPQETIAILERFATVFDGTYTRFLDLQKAEAQSREAQIELGLERVRARAMAMQKSDELAELVHTVFKELTKLHFALDRCIIMIRDPHTGGNTWWMANSEEASLPFGSFVKYHEHPAYLAYIDAWKAQTLKWIYLLEGTEKKEWDKFLFTETELSNLPQFVIDGMKSVESIFLNVSFNNFGSLTLASLEPLTEENFDILLRFAKIFEQTYTRFNDLQKAEAQAKEAHIEAALEKVRSRSLAMHKTDELQEVVTVVLEKMTDLNIELDTININIFNDGSKEANLWTAAPGLEYAVPFHIPFINHPFHTDIFTAKENGLSFFAKIYSYEEKNSYFNYAFEHSDFRNVSEAKKKLILEGRACTRSMAITKNAGIIIHRYSEKPFSENENEILKRFAKVFEQAYTRFLDLQKAEAQAREAKIEVALERVRSKAMAMHQSEDLNGAVAIVFEELDKLDLDVIRCGIGIVNKEKRTSNVWVTSKTGEGGPVQVSGDEPFDGHPLLQGTLDAWIRQEDFSYVLAGEDMIKYYKSQGSQASTNFHLPESQLIRNTDENKYTQYYQAAMFEAGGVFAFREFPFTDEAKSILKRFAGVFNLTYKRFLDIQKAEGQAREAQIELALERVRARTMAMQKSEELADAAQVLYQEFRTLDINNFSCGYMFIDEINKNQTAWVVLPDGKLLPDFITFPLTGDHVLNSRYKEWKAKQPLHVYEIQGEENREHHRFLSKHVPSFVSEEIFSHIPERIVFYSSNFSYGYLLILAEEIFTQEEQQTIIRFAKVFEQTYTRFLDLQKAEAQAREATIEVSLERVRSRAMGMQHSDELGALIGTVFTELTRLDLSLTRCVVWIMDTETLGTTWWMANSEDPDHPGTCYIPYHEHAPYLALLEQWKIRALRYEYVLEGNTKKKWDEFLFSETGAKDFPEAVKAGMAAPEKVILTVSFNNFGAMNVASLESLSEEQVEILLRFAKVFDLTYTRFLDLQKAEMQARESQIQLALERVRARTMAMQHSDELGEASALLFKQVSNLGIQTWTSGFNIWEKGDTSFIGYNPTPTGGIAGSYHIPSTEDRFFINIYEAKKRGEDFIVFESAGESLAETYRYMKTLPIIKDVLKGIEDSGFPMPTFQINHCAFFSHGFLLFITLEHYPEAHDIFIRFAKVFDQTYTRFLDLQKAEAQARESQIETGLEKVRSRTLAMQKSDELAETAAEVFKQLIGLGIEPNRLYIGIIKDESGDMEMWATDEDGTKVGQKFMFNKNENASVKKLYDGWAAKEKSVIVDMEGKELENYFHYLNEVIHIPFKGGLTQKRRVQSVAYFSRGFIGMASPDGQGTGTLHLLERFAAVFNLTFTRFNDLKMAEAHAIQAEEDLVKLQTEKKRAEDALTELKSTQTQLIQSEKMASLGELTSGIAHEIQNPLNFVNNFSEVNKELLVEMKDELKKGNIEEVNSLADDVIDNEDKIIFHGKRADAIVKGMLQHSRSSGVKEPTDINALCDEYLRLSYHGLRAKDKSFNATMKTDFDNSIGKINIIPQDIGRVVLNLINNAFYAVNERLRQAQPDKADVTLSRSKGQSLSKGYEPTVSISTKKIDNYIEIKVSDNGNGIPQNVLDKIFQPFFTTKPTGQGTGLGLSMSYDIVTKGHGGELKVETKEGEGTTFIISLPANSN